MYGHDPTNTTHFYTDASGFASDLVITQFPAVGLVVSVSETSLFSDSDSEVLASPEPQLHWSNVWCRTVDGLIFFGDPGQSDWLSSAPKPDPASTGFVVGEDLGAGVMTQKKRTMGVSRHFDKSIHQQTQGKWHWKISTPVVNLEMRRATMGFRKRFGFDHQRNSPEYYFDLNFGLLAQPPGRKDPQN